MALSMKLDVGAVTEFTERIQKTIEGALRPVAQAGAQVFYEAVLTNPQFPVSEKKHWFYGTSARAVQGPLKKSFAYGPYYPGNLRNAIYQAHAERPERSNKHKQTYEISWRTRDPNPLRNAPYGHMVEFGTSKAAAYPFLGYAAGAQREAIQEMELRFDNELAKAGF